MNSLKMEYENLLKSSNNKKNEFDGFFLQNSDNILLNKLHIRQGLINSENNSEKTSDKTFQLFPFVYYNNNKDETKQNTILSRQEVPKSQLTEIVPYNSFDKYCYLDNEKNLMDSSMYSKTDFDIDSDGKNEDKKVKNDCFVIIYNKLTYHSNLMLLKDEYKNNNLVLNILDKNFDTWFGNDFTKIAFNGDLKLTTEQEEELKKSFNGVCYRNQNNIQQEYERFISNISVKNDNSKKLSLVKALDIIKNKFDITDNVQDRIRSSELNNLFIETIQKEYNHSLLDNDIQTLFLDIISGLGLKKKRYSSGNYYYGIIKK